MWLMLNAAECYRIPLFNDIRHLQRYIFDYIMWLMLNAAEFYRIPLFNDIRHLPRT